LPLLPLVFVLPLVVVLDWLLFEDEDEDEPSRPRPLPIISASAH